MRVPTIGEKNNKKEEERKKEKEDKTGIARKLREEPRTQGRSETRANCPQ